MVVGGGDGQSTDRRQGKWIRSGQYSRGQKNANRWSSHPNWKKLRTYHRRAYREKRKCGHNGFLSAENGGVHVSAVGSQVGGLKGGTRQVAKGKRSFPLAPNLEPRTCREAAIHSQE